MTTDNVIVVGAGPAGVRAAETLLAKGIKPILIDEAVRGGGQIYRRPPPSFTRTYKDLYGSEARKAEALHRAAEGLRGRLDYRPDTLAWNLRPGTLHTITGTCADEIPFRAIIITSGATDRILPCPGWTLPGVFTLGASQILLKAQGSAIGRSVVFMGTGPLLYLVAYQYLRAGARVAAVLDTSPFRLRVMAAGDLLASPRALAWGMYFTARLVSAGVRVSFGITPVGIEGDGNVSGVRFRDRAGREQRVDCDAVAMGYHLRAETQLADLAACEFAYEPLRRQWLPRLDSYGRSTIPGVYLAGDGARLLGADAAEVGGRLAAIGLAADLGHAVDPREVRRLLRRQRRHQRFQRGIARAFPLPAAHAASLPDDALVCRCEAITAGELRRSAAGLGVTEINRGKALTRIGMGRCQGRYCGLASAEILAATLGVEVSAVGRLRTQAPVKPLPLATTAGDPT